MSLGFSIAIHAVPFFDLLDNEVKSVAETVFGSQDSDAPGVLTMAEGELVAPQGPNPQAVSAVMDNSRRRLAQGVDTFVRRLPSAARNDATTTRAAAYALVGLADERMLHYPAGGLEAWRNRLLESELYSSALAGQEIIRQARNSFQGGRGPEGGLLAPLYLAILREGFEGSLRGDVLGLSSLISALEDTVGAVRGIPGAMATDVGPRRITVPLGTLAGASIALWLAAGPILWWALAGDALEDANRLSLRIESGVAATVGEEDERSITPTSLPPPPR